MSDLIDRQAAIDAVEFGITYAKAINKSTGEVKEMFKEGNKALNEAVERIKDLPSAQPKRGRWIMQRVGEHDEYCVCSECGNQTESDEAWNYCPNCGARMGARNEAD